MGVKEEITKVRKARRRAIEGIAKNKIAKLHEEGRLTARERMELFFDRGSFVELGLLAESQCYEFGMRKHRYPTDGIIIGHGTVDGRQVCAYSEDVTILGVSV
jgi:acetyl-CoA carboxylase carboxyltransferase component